MIEQTQETKAVTIDSFDFVRELESQYNKDIKEHSSGYVADGHLTLCYCIIRFLRLTTPQPRNFDNIDQIFIDRLHNINGCSIGEISFVMGRSKSSICEYLNRTKGTDS
jgi:hypothetical protein